MRWVSTSIARWLGNISRDLTRDEDVFLSCVCASISMISRDLVLRVLECRQSRKCLGVIVPHLLNMYM